MKATFKRLKELENKINSAYYKCRDVDFFFEKKTGYVYARRWEKMMIELRGWAEYRFDEQGNDLTKDGWKEKCGTGYWDYNIGDICA
jgi:hypothetical protein